MNQIWVNRLIEGTQTWEKVPVLRREAVAKLLREQAPERYTEITGKEKP